MPNNIGLTVFEVHGTFLCELVLIVREMSPKALVLFKWSYFVPLKVRMLGLDSDSKILAEEEEAFFEEADVFHKRFERR